MAAPKMYPHAVTSHALIGPSWPESGYAPTYRAHPPCDEPLDSNSVPSSVPSGSVRPCIDVPIRSGAPACARKVPLPPTKNAYTLPSRNSGFSGSRIMDMAASLSSSNAPMASATMACATSCLFSSKTFKSSSSACAASAGRASRTASVYTIQIIVMLYLPNH